MRACAVVGEGEGRGEEGGVHVAKRNKHGANDDDEEEEVASADPTAIVKFTSKALPYSSTFCCTLLVVIAIDARRSRILGVYLSAKLLSYVCRKQQRSRSSHKNSGPLELETPVWNLLRRKTDPPLSPCT